ncbi:MAG: ABC transporter ATP-binding protein [Deltaproteobacteria bacterium]|nr:ABC transporter ATP-binding protein [Deltaproteobacteria bacterium]MBW2339312.1 ABC transporter ATP-binding protein [Deltaproteobacteria bacterium]
MRFDYGHMEDGHLGKPYNMRLLKRLIPYSRPYRKPIVLALSLTILITLFDLAIPYLPKIAIDKYILSLWYPVNQKERQNLATEFSDRYGHLVVATEETGLGFISNAHIKQIDPGDLRRYYDRGIISREGFYRVSVEVVKKNWLMNSEALIRGVGSSVYISGEALKSFSPDQIAGLRGSDLNGLLLVGLFLLLLIGGSLVLNYWEFYLLEKCGQHMMQDIRMELFGWIQRQAIQFFDRNPVGRLVTRVTNDIENLNEMFKSVLITIFKDVFLLSGIIVILVCLNWRLAFISFMLLPAVFALTLFFSTQAREVFREIRQHIAAINAFLQERLSGMRIIQLFAQEKSQLKRFEELNHRNYLASLRQIRIFAVFMPFMEVFSSAGIGLLVWYGGGKVIGEQLSLGSLVAFIGYIQMFFKPIRDISEKYNIMQSAMASMERIFALMDQKEVIQEPAIPKRPVRSEGHVEFKNVSFSYNDGFPVLKGVSFEIKPGQIVALVGYTGSGKTTTVSLLERFYEFEKGNILFDGLDIREWGISELRSRIGLVLQDVFIFAGTIAENICLGDEKINREKLAAVSRQANAYQFINRLPEGFSHEVKEEGVTLSAGERQLLALSRALAYDPTILVLDEATSSVDPETERLIQDSIFTLSKRQTTLIIAHRPSTIQMADRILVMHRGHIVEQGTHEELIALKNIYYRLNLLHKKES